MKEWNGAPVRQQHSMEGEGSPLAPPAHLHEALHEGPKGRVGIHDFSSLARRSRRRCGCRAERRAAPLSTPMPMPGTRRHSPAWASKVREGARGAARVLCGSKRSRTSGCARRSHFYKAMIWLVGCVCVAVAVAVVSADR